MSSACEVEEEDDEGEDGHFDNASEGKAVEAYEDEGIESDSVDELCVLEGWRERWIEI